MENKYITVAYKLYVMQDGQKTLVEEATAEHPFQFISGLGTTLERFESEVAALNKGDKFDFVIPSAEAYGEYMMQNVSSKEPLFLCKTMKDIISMPLWAK